MADAATAAQNAKRFLDMLSKAEGSGYDTVVGGGKFRDFNRHPRIVGVRTKEGPSTAAGRYQITATTYDSLGGGPFTPRHQDVMALRLIDQAGALDDVKNGDFRAAANKLGGVWASLPSSKYSQRKLSMDQFLALGSGGPVTRSPDYPQPGSSRTIYDFLPAGAKETYPLEVINAKARKALTMRLPDSYSDDRAASIAAAVVEFLPRLHKGAMTNTNLDAAVAGMGNEPVHDRGSLVGNPFRESSGGGVDWPGPDPLESDDARAHFKSANPFLQGSASAFQSAYPIVAGGVNKVGALVNSIVTPPGISAVTGDLIPLPDPTQRFIPSAPGGFANEVGELVGGIGAFAVTAGALTPLVGPTAALGVTAALSETTWKGAAISATTTMIAGKASGMAAERIAPLLASWKAAGVPGKLAGWLVSHMPGSAAFGALEPVMRTEVLRMTGEEAKNPTGKEMLLGSAKLLLATLAMGVPTGDLRRAMTSEPPPRTQSPELLAAIDHINRMAQARYPRQFRETSPELARIQDSIAGLDKTRPKKSDKNYKRWERRREALRVQELRLLAKIEWQKRPEPPAPPAPPAAGPPQGSPPEGPPPVNPVADPPAAPVAPPASPTEPPAAPAAPAEAPWENIRTFNPADPDAKGTAARLVKFIINKYGKGMVRFVTLPDGTVETHVHPSIAEKFRPRTEPTAPIEPAAPAGAETEAGGARSEPAPAANVEAPATTPPEAAPEPQEQAVIMNGHKWALVPKADGSASIVVTKPDGSKVMSEDHPTMEAASKRFAQLVEKGRGVEASPAPKKPALGRNEIPDKKKIKLLTDAELEAHARDAIKRWKALKADPQAFEGKVLAWKRAVDQAVAEIKLRRAAPPAEPPVSPVAAPSAEGGTPGTVKPPPPEGPTEYKLPDGTRYEARQTEKGGVLNIYDAKGELVSSTEHPSFWSAAAEARKLAKWDKPKAKAAPEEPRTIGTVTLKTKETMESAPQGECFRNVRKWAKDHPGSVIVHGKMTVNGETFDHAWVEIDGDVVDPTAGFRADAGEFYRSTKAQSDAKYTPEQIAKLIAKTKHLGPYSAEEASGKNLSHNGEAPALADGSVVPGVTKDVEEETPEQSQSVLDQTRDEILGHSDAMDEYLATARKLEESGKKNTKKYRETMKAYLSTYETVEDLRSSIIDRYGEDAWAKVHEEILKARGNWQEPAGDAGGSAGDSVDGAARNATTFKEALDILRDERSHGLELVAEAAREKALELKVRGPKGIDKALNKKRSAEEIGALVDGIMRRAKDLDEGRSADDVSDNPIDTVDRGDESVPEAGNKMEPGDLLPAEGEDWQRDVYLRQMDSELSHQHSQNVHGYDGKDLEGYEEMYKEISENYGDDTAKQMREYIEGDGKAPFRDANTPRKPYVRPSRPSLEEIEKVIKLAKEAPDAIVVGGLHRHIQKMAYDSMSPEGVEVANKSGRWGNLISNHYWEDENSVGTWDGGRFSSGSEKFSEMKAAIRGLKKAGLDHDARVVELVVEAEKAWEESGKGWGLEASSIDKEILDAITKDLPLDKDNQGIIPHTETAIAELFPEGTSGKLADGTQWRLEVTPPDREAEPGSRDADGRASLIIRRPVDPAGVEHRYGVGDFYQVVDAREGFDREAYRRSQQPAPPPKKKRGGGKKNPVAAAPDPTAPAEPPKPSATDSEPHPPTMDVSISTVLRSNGDKAEWSRMIRDGATDEEIKAALVKAFGQGSGVSLGRWNIEHGTNKRGEPWIKTTRPNVEMPGEGDGPTSLRGKDLVARVREQLKITVAAEAPRFKTGETVVVPYSGKGKNKKTERATVISIEPGKDGDYIYTVRVARGGSSGRVVKLSSKKGEGNKYGVRDKSYTEHKFSQGEIRRRPTRDIRSLETKNARFTRALKARVGTDIEKAKAELEALRTEEIEISANPPDDGPSPERAKAFRDLAKAREHVAIAERLLRGLEDGAGQERSANPWYESPYYEPIRAAEGRGATKLGALEVMARKEDFGSAGELATFAGLYPDGSFRDLDGLRSDLKHLGFGVAVVEQARGVLKGGAIGEDHVAFLDKAKAVEEAFDGFDGTNAKEIGEQIHDAVYPNSPEAIDRAEARAKLDEDDPIPFEREPKTDTNLETNHARMPGTARNPVPRPNKKGKTLPVPPSVRGLPKSAPRGLPEAPLPKGYTPEGDITILQHMLAGKEDFLEGLRDVLADVANSANPLHQATITEGGRRALDVFMEEKGIMNERAYKTSHTQKGLQLYWDTVGFKSKMDFWDRFERGDRQADPVFQKIADNYKKRMADFHNEILKHKHGAAFIENFYPHLWKDDKKARKFFSGRRAGEGTRSFLKKRFHSDKRAGMEAGLKLRTENPEIEMQLYESNGAKFIMYQRLLARSGSKGADGKPGLKVLHFNFIGADLPDGHRKLDPRWAQVFLSPETPVSVSQWVDESVLNALQETMHAIGATHVRKAKLHGALGMSKSTPGNAGTITTRHGVGLVTWAHELGHAMDSKYGMRDAFIRRSSTAERKELRALADLRFEGKNPGQAYKDYVRKGQEKMAVLIQAYVHMPGRMKQEFPLLHSKLLRFLSTYPELKALRDVKPSLLNAELEGTVLRTPGMVVGGSWSAPEGLARILNNNESRDFVMSGRFGRTAMAWKNNLTMLELGVSGFHFGNVTLIAGMHMVGTGIGDLLRGEIRQGIRKMGTGMMPGSAGYFYMMDGYEILKNASPMLSAAFRGGMQLETNPEYMVGAIDRVMKHHSIYKNKDGLYTRQQRLLSAGLAVMNTPMAIVNAPMRVLTDFYIPQVKIGAFADELSSEMGRRAKDLASGKITQTELERRVWANIDDRFGMLAYDNLFFHRTLKSALMLLTRAYGWQHGTQRALGGAAFIDLPRFIKDAGIATYDKAMDKTPRIVPDFTPRMRFALAMVFQNIAYGALYHWFHTGKPPENIQDCLEPKTGVMDNNKRPIRIVLPTYWKEVQGWTHDPLKQEFGRIPGGRGMSSVGHGGKLSAPITDVMDFLENQTYRGPMYNPDDKLMKQAEDVIWYYAGKRVPFMLQNATRPKYGTTGQKLLMAGESFFGVTRAPKEKSDANAPSVTTIKKAKGKENVYRGSQQ